SELHLEWSSASQGAGRERGNRWCLSVSCHENGAGGDHVVTACSHRNTAELRRVLARGYLIGHVELFEGHLRPCQVPGREVAVVLAVEDERALSCLVCREEDGKDVRFFNVGCHRASERCICCCFFVGCKPGCNRIEHVTLLVEGNLSHRFALIIVDDHEKAA